MDKNITKSRTTLVGLALTACLGAGVAAPAMADAASISGHHTTSASSHHVKRHVVKHHKKHRRVVKKHRRVVKKHRRVVHHRTHRYVPIHHTVPVTHKTSPVVNKGTGRVVVAQGGASLSNRNGDKPSANGVGNYCTIINGVKYGTKCSAL